MVNRLSRKLFVLTVVLFFASAVACSRTVPLENPSFSVSASKPTAVRTAIVSALRSRGWTLVSDKPGDILAKISPRSHSALIQIAYSTKNVSITLKEASNLAESTGKDGTKTIHKNYMSWVTNLEKDILSQLSYSEADRG